MASSLLLLLDDIASVLDDVSVMTKAAVKKTAGVLGDDLALNAKQVAGVRPARELPVVWAVARGSAFNKLVLVPAALAISWLAPGAVTPLLMIGGGYLCYEGMEKILHGLLHRDGHHAAGVASVEPPVEEADKIAGAIRTDFILSAEIIVIALGVVAGRPLPIQLAVLVAISAAMTVGVYGLVAGIVKLDDLGAIMASGRSAVARAVGRGILAAAPWLMRGLSVAGTAAMFLVGGGIIAHGIPALHHAVHGSVAEWLGDAQGGATARTVLTMALDAGVGMAVGLALVAALSLGTRLASHVRGLRTHG
jgi:predicted DNA repair protein MutK